VQAVGIGTVHKKQVDTLMNDFLALKGK